MGKESPNTSEKLKTPERLSEPEVKGLLQKYKIVGNKEYFVVPCDGGTVNIPKWKEIPVRVVGKNGEEKFDGIEIDTALAATVKYPDKDLGEALKLLKLEATKKYPGKDLKEALKLLSKEK